MRATISQPLVDGDAREVAAPNRIGVLGRTPANANPHTKRLDCKIEAKPLSIYVNKNNGFEQAETVTRECPHCGAHAQLIPVATPSYEALAAARPRHVGIAYRCAACNEPRFVRAAARAFEPERVELSSNLVEIERPRERFQFGYLPEPIERMLRETLDCYTAGLYNAFASMSRRTVRAALADLDANAPTRWREIATEVLRIGEVDETTSNVLETVLFGAGEEPPELEAQAAAVLIEVVKDLLYQGYVRTAKLKAAMKMRRFFAGETSSKVTSIDRVRRELA